MAAVMRLLQGNQQRKFNVERVRQLAIAQIARDAINDRRNQKPLNTVAEYPTVKCMAISNKFLCKIILLELHFFETYVDNPRDYAYIYHMKRTKSPPRNKEK